MAPRKTKTTTSVKTTTKKNPWRSSHVPLPSWIMFWALILCTMALIVVNFSQAFAPAPVDAIDNGTYGEWAAIRAGLEQQVRNLQAQVGTPSEPRGRLLATHSAPTNDCSLQWATSTADIMVPYTDPKTKVSMSLPYSFNWGNAQFAFTPYAIADDGRSSIDFGPGIFDEKGCGTYRDSAIEITTNTSTPNDIRTDAKAKHGTNITERTINGIPVISYRVQFDDVRYNYWYGFGRTFQYRIMSKEWLSDADAVKIFQSLKVVK